MPLRLVRCIVVALGWSGIALTLAGPLSAQPFPPAPGPELVAEVRAALAAMKADERGPFLRIRWYCSDGTVHAPQGTPCRERGGGVQHAEHGPLALGLAARGYHTGTILQAMDYEAFADTARAGYRLRELVMERYLVEVDDGWVLRRARYYRGALQVEDEERQGHAFLTRRFSDPAWVAANYLLALRLTATVPHLRVGEQGTTERVRALATEAANLDPGFMRTRVKIHSLPGREDLATVTEYLARGGHPPELERTLTELRDALRAQYDAGRALRLLEAYAGRVPAPLAGELRSLRATLAAGDPAASLQALADVSVAVRRAAEESPDGARTLDLLALQLSLQDRAFVLAQEAAAPGASRADALARLLPHLSLAYGAGLLSGRERAAAAAEVEALRAQGTVGALDYKTRLGYVGRALDWGRGTVRGTFLPVVDRYAPVEPRAAGLVDDILRGSVLLPLSRRLDDLQADADRALGSSHEVLGLRVAGGVRGLNPGVAVRTLRVVEGELHDTDPQVIYVLPETPTELHPVAGVLTLDEGNLLSHVQLLARNLGIPNASLRPEMLDPLRRAHEREVFYAVTPLGRVLLKWPDELDEAEAALLPRATPTPRTRHELDTSRLELERWRAIPLSELRAGLSGIVVGPKAANLGQLAADFPGRVSRAAALPFGMFVRHADRPWDGSEGTVLEELRGAYAEAARMREAGRSEAEVRGWMLGRLAWVRSAIEGLPWVPELRDEVVRALRSTLGGDLSAGVFVRSDTNVEDLPQFSGAGLNMTVAHQTTEEDVLAAVKRVWTSPFSERAWLWRSQILAEQGDVYPSVLLQESVPSEKSGVLITSGLQEGGPDDLTVVTAEGVGGAVDGEDAETLVVGPDGTVRLLSQAKAPRRRELTRGGTRWVAAQRPDTLLRPAELAQLRRVVAEWEDSLRGTPDADQTWDMEWGFVDGRLWLFQVRPFVRFRNSDVQARLEALDAEVLRNAARPVSLAGPLESR